MLFRLLSRFPVAFAGLFLWLSMFVGFVVRFDIGRTLSAILSSVAVLLTGLVVRRVWDRIEEGRLLRYYEGRFENVYVVSRHPRTGEEFTLGEDLDPLVVWADHSEVFATVKEEEEWLDRSGNDWKAKGEIKVLPFIFQDAEAINENWVSEFPARVIDAIRNDRAKHHRRIKKSAPDWYNQHGNGQRGVIWERVEN